MWIFTKDGFFSAVELREDHNYVMIRARFKEDLVTLMGKTVSKLSNELDRIEDTPDADYPYRLVLPKVLWSKYVTDAANAINYDNFKGAALAGQYDTERWDRYHAVWESMKYGGNLVDLIS